jgi:putative ABC transport system permease protein
MRMLVAVRILTHETARSVLAVLGVFAAIVLVFLQLGFYSSVPVGATMIYKALAFDLVLISRDYAFQIRTDRFPRRRLQQALALPEVESAAGFYQRYARWLNIGGRLQREVFVMGVDPDRKTFLVPAIASQSGLLKRPDTALVDAETRPEFGSRPGTTVEIEGRAVQIVGEYDLGMGFLGLGAIVISDQNFIRLFPMQPLSEVHAGLLRLRPGTDADAAAARLRTLLPNDTEVLTRSQFEAKERAYWLSTTSTGLVFGFGAIVAAIVGTAILYQTLSTLILRNLREYAVLKAMGYAEDYLAGIVVTQALLISLVAFTPAVIAAYGLYDFTRWATSLPVYMTSARIGIVLAATLAASIAGGLLTFRLLRRADPADLF